MTQLFVSKIKRSTCRDEGFSLVEVLISILMIAGFLATAMQALLSATMIKVRAEELSEATNWMQEDLEVIRFEANQLKFIDTNGDGVQDEYDVSSGCATGFAGELKTQLENGPLPHQQAVQNKESAIGKRTYQLERVLDASDGRILKITYQVKNPANGNEVIGELYSEVIPDVALACP